MATAKTGGFVINIVTRVAVRGWRSSWRDVLAVVKTGDKLAKNVVKTKDNWVTILATAKTKIGDSLVIDVVTAKTGKDLSLIKS